MLPDIENAAWEQFVTGKKLVQTSKATFNMMVQANKMNYSRDSSPDNVKVLITKCHDFLTRHGALFTAEIAQILK